MSTDMAQPDTDNDTYPVIAAVNLDVRAHDDEHALSDFVNDIDNLIHGYCTISDEGEGVSEAFLPLLRELLDAIYSSPWGKDDK